jgi:hypothetical protein
MNAPPMPPPNKRPSDGLESSGPSKRLFVPQVDAPSSSSNRQQSSSSKIYYASQDPHRLGAKGDIIE